MIIDADGREQAPKRGAPVGHLSMTGADKRNELLRNAIRDAEVMVISAMAMARIKDPLNAHEASDRAERDFRDKWPGLAALIDHADGAR